MGRDLALSSIPSNGRALAIAIAVDELLRASWAELALRSERSERKARESSEHSESTDPESLVEGRAEKTKLTFGVEGTYARSFDHYDAFGAVSLVDVLLRRHAWVEGRAGFSSALKRKVPEGSVAVSGPMGALTLGACLSRPARVSRLCLGVRTGLELLTFTGESDTSAKGKSALNSVVTSALVGQVRIRLLRRLSLTLGAGAGGALRGARVSNGSRTLSRIDGLLLQSSVGLGVER